MTGRGLLREAAWVIGYFAAAGVVAGLVWWQVVDPPYFVRTSKGAVMDQAQLSRRVQADGWFLVIGVVAGLIGGVALTRWRDREPLATLLLGFAASIAGGWLALRVGTALGHSDVTTLARQAEVGAHIPDSLDVISTMVLIAWPLGYLLGAVAILWGTGRPDNDVPEDDRADLQHQD